MTSVAYLNGAFVPECQAQVGIFDGAFLHGAGLFETMRAEGGRVFRLESHMDRLRRSAERILTPLTREELPSADAFAEILERNELTAARVRMTVSAGSMREADEDGAHKVTACVTTASLSAYPAEHYECGVPVAVCDFRQSTTDPVAAHKTTAHLPRLLGLRQARQKRCLEALWFTTSNQLAEGCISNVFIVRGRVLKTPPLDTPVLPGIARAIILDIAKGQAIPCEERAISIDDLLDADEVFLTNAIMQVMPVSRVERHDIAGGKVGPLTRQLLRRYRELVRQECES
jgi:branched-chain amino acid aminotransferase